MEEIIDKIKKQQEDIDYLLKQMNLLDERITNIWDYLTKKFNYDNQKEKK